MSINKHIKVEFIQTDQRCLQVLTKNEVFLMREYIFIVVILLLFFLKYIIKCHIKI